MSKKSNADSDLQGIGRLVTEATIGITDLVEAMHRRIIHPPFLPSSPIQQLISHIAGITYQNIRWSTRMIGSGVDQALGKLAPLFGKMKSSKEREALRAALNGVIGDYLEEKENPLQIAMQFRHEGKALALDPQSLKQAYPALNGKILLLVHGSCMNDLQWTHKAHNHGIALAEELGKTAVYLHYNSGRHISANGQDFNELLEKLVHHWPVPLEEVTILAHSMGGLVARSATYYGQAQHKSWIKYLQKIVFLGTPHHGAFLEKAGNYLDVLLGAIPYTQPLARLGKIRSAGLTDLRYGNLLEEDWQDDTRFEIRGDQRRPVPLPPQVDCYSIAALIGPTSNSKRQQLLGDRLVSLKSALGQHTDPAKELNFKKANTWIAEESSHLDLLSDAKIYAKIKAWLT